MTRPLIGRSTDAAELDIPLLQDFPSAFRCSTNERDWTAEDARDLFERTIRESIQAEDEHLASIAAPFRSFIHKKSRVDEALGKGVEQLALTRGITRCAGVMTIYHHLDQHGALRDTGASASTWRS